ncbi:hypothetical protein LOTGIDRAFT_232615 [Lottia gigantea]|uniref:Uncharacterized protein n=1 Tax=Lottia gigantea TaxID=225164 RepID=V4BWX9_LOTGI|nr:hypothetical protein LOTGIDRAFT_232615 [Lottia gigantea]ESO93549.1 hypothetical protein LOTGIDRAFT_232615 [Lottia gigantea]
MRAVEVFVLLILVGSLTAAKLERSSKGERIKGQRNRPGQLRNGAIVSQVPVLSPQERSRQRNNFIDKAGRRIVRLMDFVQGVLSNRGKLPLPATTGIDADNKKMAMIKARRTFYSSAAQTIQGLELKTKNTFKDLKDSAKLLPVVENPRPLKPGRKQNKFPSRKPNRPRKKQNKFANRRRKMNKFQQFRARKANRKVQAARRFRKPVSTPKATPEAITEANGTQLK